MDNDPKQTTKLAASWLRQCFVVSITKVWFQSHNKHNQRFKSVWGYQKCFTKVMLLKGNANRCKLLTDSYFDVLSERFIFNLKEFFPHKHLKIQKKRKHSQFLQKQNTPAACSIFHTTKITHLCVLSICCRVKDPGSWRHCNRVKRLWEWQRC